MSRSKLQTILDALDLVKNALDMPPEERKRQYGTEGLHCIVEIIKTRVTELDIICTSLEDELAGQ